MPNYAPLDLIKRQAKALKKTSGQTLAFCQEQIAVDFGFSDFHEVTTVAKRDPDDVRLIRAAFGVEELSEVIYLPPVYSALESEFDDVMSGPMAETNAYDFIVEDLEVTASVYDHATGVLTLDLSCQYIGAQDPDRPYSGTSFFLDAIIRLARRDNQWTPIEEDPWLEIISSERDDEREYRLHPEDFRV